MDKQWIIEVETQIADAVMEVEDGNIDPLEPYAELKHLNDILTAAVKQVGIVALEESENWDENSFDHKGVKFTKVKGSKRYSYKNITEWKEKSSELKEIESIAKSTFSLYEQGKQVIGKDGDVAELPEVTYSADSLRVKFLEV